MPGQQLPKDWDAGNPEWSSGTLTWSASGAVRSLWMLTALAAALVSPAAIIGLPEKLKEEEWLAVVVIGCFILLCIGLFLYACYATMIMLRYGKSSLQLRTTPGVLGGSFQASLILPPGLANPEVIHLVFTCTRYTVSGSSKNRGVRQEVYWRDEHDVSRQGLEVGREGHIVPVSFLIPYDLPQTQTRTGSEWITWSIGAYAAMPGVDYQSHFDVPVFQTPEGDPSQTRDCVLEKRPAESSDAPPDMGCIRLFETGSSFDLVVPPFRRPGTAIVCFLIAAGLVLAADACRQNDVFIVVPIVLILVAAFMLLISIHWLLACVDLRICRGHATLKSGWLGLRRSREFDGKDVQKIEVSVPQQQSSDQKANTGVYSIDVLLDNDRTITLADLTSDRQLAEWIAARLEANFDM